MRHEIWKLDLRWVSGDDDGDDDDDDDDDGDDNDDDCQVDLRHQDAKEKDPNERIRLKTDTHVKVIDGLTES